MPKCDFNNVALHLFWSRTLVWVSSCKFAAYFQNTFSWEHLRTAASGVSKWINLLSVLHGSVICFHDPLDENDLVAVRRLIHQEVSTKVRQRGELNWASQLKASGQQISSTIMSRPDKTRLERPSLVKAPLLVWCQFAYICLCAAAERLPRLVRRKVAMLRAFAFGF